MVLDIMSGPPLPSRATRSSQKGRPLPSKPKEPTQHVSNPPLLKERKLPPPPTSEISPKQQSFQSRASSTLDTSRQYTNTTRPLPPPPVEEEVNSPISHSTPNGRASLRRGLPPTPADNAPAIRHSNSTKRPLPPPPKDDIPVSIPVSNRPTKSKVEPPRLPERKSSVTNLSIEKNDFEKRFYFHDVKDFPQPDEFEDIPKQYSSSKSRQTCNDTRRRRKKTSPR